MTLLRPETLIESVHTLSSAAWFGALVYRAFFVEPRASRFFRGSADYEHFSLQQAHGMRYVVLLALLACGFSGFALMGLRWNSDDLWQPLVAAKVALWGLGSAVFAYISWVYWPRRVFTAPADWPRVRRQGFVLACTMIAISGLGIILGQACRTIRTAG